MKELSNSNGNFDKQLGVEYENHEIGIAKELENRNAYIHKPLERL